MRPVLIPYEPVASRHEHFARKMTLQTSKLTRIHIAFEWYTEETFQGKLSFLLDLYMFKQAYILPLRFSSYPNSPTGVSLPCKSCTIHPNRVATKMRSLDI